MSVLYLTFEVKG